MQADGGWTSSCTQDNGAATNESCHKKRTEQQSSFPRALAKEQLRKLKAKNFPGTLEEAKDRNDSALKAATRFGSAGLRLEEFQTPVYRLSARG